MRLAIAIMAAGKGTRLKSKRPKVLHEIGGSPLLRHVIRAATQIVSPQDIYVIVGHEAERVKAAIGDTGVQFVLQAEQHGTGHAIQCARASVSGYDTLLVLSGDVPLIRPETIARMRDFHFTEEAAMTILTAAPPNPFGYGSRLSRCDRDRRAKSSYPGTGTSAGD
jgi:bifunctional UDP-N-acetylglucosamine pyrophosphorylase/glucosamine-1-phosphate N-acetyltransferase